MTVRVRLVTRVERLEEQSDRFLQPLPMQFSYLNAKGTSGRGLRVS
jgi:hypothetical protein